jgi:uncharacterized OB-fold protein
MQLCKPCDAFYFYPRPFCPGMAAPSGEYHQRSLEKHGRASCAVTIR